MMIKPKYISPSKQGTEANKDDATEAVHSLDIFTKKLVHEHNYPMKHFGSMTGGKIND